MYQDNGIPRTLTIHGIKVRFWEYHDPHLPTIVMVHGLRGTHHGLLTITNRLPHHHIIIADLPGFGDSPSFNDRQHTIENYSVFIHDLIVHLGLKQPHLLGHSFGSLIAAHYAAEYPDELHKLILVNPISTPARRGSKKLSTNLAALYYWLGTSLPSRAGNALLRGRTGTLLISYAMAKTKDRQLRTLIHREHLTHFSRFYTPRSVNEAFRASISSTVQDFAHKIKVPTLLIAGARDEIAPLRGQRQLQAQLADSELVVIEKVGHLVHYETPDQAAQAIAAFVA